MSEPIAVDLRIFVAVAGAHSLSGAAASLGFPLYTVSRALKRLESHAEVALVRRGREGISLTDTGHGYLAACYKILEAQQEAEQVLRPEKREIEGVLRLAAPMEFTRSVLSSLLPKFQAIYPRLKIEVALYCSDWDQEPKAAHDIFLKVRTPRDSRRHLRIFPAIRQGLFASPRLLAGIHAPQHPADLMTLPCLGYGSGTGDAWTLARDSDQITVRPRANIAVADPDVLTRLAVASAGVAVLPLWLAEEEIETGRLVRLLPDWSLEPIVFCALFNGRLRPQSKEHALIDHLKSTLGSKDDPRCAGRDPGRFFVL